MARGRKGKDIKMGTPSQQTVLKQHDVDAFMSQTRDSTSTNTNTNMDTNNMNDTRKPSKAAQPRRILEISLGTSLIHPSTGIRKAWSVGCTQSMEHSSGMWYDGKEHPSGALEDVEFAPCDDPNFNEGDIEMFRGYLGCHGEEGLYLDEAAVFTDEYDDDEDGDGDDDELADNDDEAGLVIADGKFLRYRHSRARAPSTSSSSDGGDAADDGKEQCKADGGGGCSGADLSQEWGAGVVCRHEQ